jgi:HSP90 family molecular chaperone
MALFLIGNIFLRELVSNAADAISKMKKLTDWARQRLEKVKSIRLM